MKKLKKHKIKLILLFVFFLLMVFAVIGIINLLYPNSKKNIYGNRLEGIENYNIDNNKLNSVNSVLNEKDEVIKVKSNLSGKIINFTITVSPETAVDSSKALTDIILENFDDEEKKYFDFQVFIINEDSEKELYPIIGYKHFLSLNFVWSN